MLEASRRHDCVRQPLESAGWCCAVSRRCVHENRRGTAVMNLLESFRHHFLNSLASQQNHRWVGRLLLRPRLLIAATISGRSLVRPLPLLLQCAKNCACAVCFSAHSCREPHR